MNVLDIRDRVRYRDKGPGCRLSAFSSVVIDYNYKLLCRFREWKTEIINL